MGSSSVIPPPPAGFVLPGAGSSIPPPPPGFVVGGSPAAPASSSWLDTVLSALGGGALGAVKGAGSTASRVMASGALNGILGPGAQALTKDNPYNVALQPEGTAQNVGFGGEQMGEYILPGALTGGMSTGAGVLTRAALEALSTGAVSAAQGGDASQIGTSAALGAAGPLIGRAIKPIASKLSASAVKGMTQALAPTTTVMKGKAAKVVPGLLERGVSGSRPSMLAQAEEGLAATGPAYDSIAANQGKLPVDTQKVVDTLEAMKDKYKVTTTDGTRAAATKGAENAVNLITDLQQRIATTEPTLESIRSLRSILGEETEKAFGKLPAEQQVTEKIKDATYKALKRELGKASPDLAAVDKEYSFWSNVKDVLTATEKRTGPQEGGLLKGIGTRAATGVGLLGAASGSPQTVALAVVGDGLNRLFASAAYKSWSAVQKDQLARAMAGGSFDQIWAALGRGLAATTRTAAQPSQQSK